ncbi:hypothetical protein M1K46_24250 [Fictibacillus sp. WQ 8-8]|uniref:hypothetical protein n=1 Tax=Fictibacillus sp. WQ 8-8 TaxID=2938788 RepID=UPI00210AEA4A|nr:hypothetical protein [Fictibacillus sp. WQ 8-8]MCQ6268689.1 hypothetical protein [Fictibacillus sp. WQ 8-8]
MKKLIISLVLGSALFLPANSAFASSGWDYVGESTFSKASVPVKSTGGDFKVCLAEGWSWEGYVKLMENDPDGKDEVVDPLLDFGKWLDKDHCAVWTNLDKYVDGDNNRAEFYIVKSQGDDVKIRIYYYD